MKKIKLNKPTNPSIEILQIKILQIKHIIHLNMKNALMCLQKTWDANKKPFKIIIDRKIIRNVIDRYRKILELKPLKRDLSYQKIIKGFEKLSTIEQKMVLSELKIMALNQKENDDYHISHNLKEKCQGKPISIQQQNDNCLMKWSEIELEFKITGNQKMFEHIFFENKFISYIEIDNQLRQHFQDIINEYYCSEQFQSNDH